MVRVIPRHNINLDRKEILALIHGVLGPSAAIGDAVRLFEDEFAAFHGVRHAVAVTSGRVALSAVLDALRIPDGAEIIVPAYSFHTIPDVVRACGYVPVYADSHPKNYALDPERIEASVSEKTAAIIVIHPFGQAAPMEGVLEVAERLGIHVIEDPSQSIGACIPGRRVGAIGKAACFSLVHGKNMMTFKGGMVLTDDDSVYSRVLRRVVGTDPPDDGRVRSLALSGLAQWALSTRIGFVGGVFPAISLMNLVDRRRLNRLFEEERSPFVCSGVETLSNLQAALGRLQLDRLDKRNALRRRNAEGVLRGLDGQTGIRLPEVVGGGEGTWNALPVRVADGIRFQRDLLFHGVDTRADYMTVFAHEEEWKRHGDVVYLPNHPGMGDADVEYVVRAVRAVLTRIIHEDSSRGAVS